MRIDEGRSSGSDIRCGMRSRPARSAIVLLAAVACLLLANPPATRADVLTEVATGRGYCVGSGETLTVGAKLVRDLAGPQFSNGETVTFAVEEVVSPPNALLSLEMVDDTIVMPDDWEGSEPGLMLLDLITLELSIRATAEGTATGTILFTNGLVLGVEVVVEDCTSQPPPSGCDGLFRGVVHVGDSFDFSGNLEVDEPEPFVVFRSDDGRERVETGSLQPDQRHEFTIEITPDWIGIWTAELYSGEPDDDPCVDRFSVVGSATEEPHTPAASDPEPDATSRLTLPASSTRATNGGGTSSLATLLVVMVAAAVSVAALVPSQRNRR